MPKNVGNIFWLSSVWLYFHLLRMFEGRTFTVINRLSGEECASTLLARCEYIPIRSAVASLPPRAKTALTLGDFISSI